MFLARKITRAKWDIVKDLSEGEISADVVTADLRTEGNSLSFWQCGGGGETEIEEAALAIASGRDSVDKLDLVWLAEEELRADGQRLRSTDGRTAVIEMIPRHVDVYGLDYVRLGNVARHIVAAIEKRRFRRLTKRHTTSLLVGAVEEGRIELADLQMRVLKAVRGSIETRE